MATICFCSSGRCSCSVPVYVMVDGLCGGCSIDPSAFETVMCLSGGSGATFTIGPLDELVGKCLQGGHGRSSHERLNLYGSSAALVRILTLSGKKCN